MRDTKQKIIVPIHQAGTQDSKAKLPENSRLQQWPNSTPRMSKLSSVVPSNFNFTTG